MMILKEKLFIITGDSNSTDVDGKHDYGTYDEDMIANYVTGDVDLPSCG